MAIFKIDIYLQPETYISVRNVVPTSNFQTGDGLNTVPLLLESTSWDNKIKSKVRTVTHSFFMAKACPCAKL